VSVGTTLRGLARMIGISVIFSIVGPFAFAALVLAIVASFGAPLAQLFATFAGHDLFSAIVSVALWVLTIAAWLAAIPPSAMAGLIFAFAAVCADLNRIWMAWLAAAAGIAGVILLGNFVIPGESSAVILPSVQSADQSLRLFGILAVLAFLPATLCWWLAKPLHRASIAA
jgi:hypothetical protein